MARAVKAVSNPSDIWLAAGVRTPFARAGGALAKKDALDLSVPVVKAMLAKAGRPDLMIWGAVIPNLTVSNLAREALIEAGADPTAKDARARTPADWAQRMDHYALVARLKK